MRKTLSFAAVHFTVAFSVGFLMTGSVWVGGALAMVEPAINTVAFHLHEKVWKRLEGRRAQPAAPSPGLTARTFAVDGNLSPRVLSHNPSPAAPILLVKGNATAALKAPARVCSPGRGFAITSSYGRDTGR